MDTAIKFLYLSEPDMIRAGVTDMDACVEAMEDLLLTLHKGDYVMGGKNHNSHGCMVTFPDDPEFEGMPKNAEDRRFMAMPAYLGGRYQMAGMKWYVGKPFEFLPNRGNSRCWLQISGKRGCKNSCYYRTGCYGENFPSCLCQRETGH